VTTDAATSLAVFFGMDAVFWLQAASTIDWSDEIPKARFLPELMKSKRRQWFGYWPISDYSRTRPRRDFLFPGMPGHLEDGR
jgi:hypothetical protein